MKKNLVNSNKLQVKSYKVKGFTLVELLVVMAVIGILASLSVPVLNSVRVRSRDTKRKADIDSIKKALIIYYEDKKTFPISSGDNSCSTDWDCIGTGFEALKGSKGLIPLYSDKLPDDPKMIIVSDPLSDGKSFAYMYLSCPTTVSIGTICEGALKTNGAFFLAARLENSNDGDTCGRKNYTNFAGKNICRFMTDDMYVVKYQP